ncbi:MAG: 3D domain-containing protein [Tumebacillaceae bacterium]
MKKRTKQIGGMTLAMAILFCGSSAVHAADVKYGMTGALALAAVHAQTAVDVPVPTVEKKFDDQRAKTMAASAPVELEKPAVPTVAGMEYTKQLNIVASAYTPNNIMSEWGGLTYTGTKVRQGVIAVYPNVIPLGSKVYITGCNTPLLPAGGFVATAEDTGGAIKGNRIDIFLNGTQQQGMQFGMQNVKVYVLK